MSLLSFLLLGPLFAVRSRFVLADAEFLTNFLDGFVHVEECKCRRLLQPFRFGSDFLLRFRVLPQLELERAFLR